MDQKKESKLGNDIRWKLKTVLKKFIKENSLTMHQLDSYNNLILVVIPDILAEFKVEATVLKNDQHVVVTIAGHYFLPPQHLESNRKLTLLTPNICRLRNLNYNSRLEIDVRERRYKTKDGNMISDTIHKRILMFEIPVMVGSYLCILHDKNEEERIKLGECRNDPLSWFIVRGKERTLISFERLKNNQPYLFWGKPSDTKRDAYAEVRSYVKGNRTRTFTLIFKKGKFTVELPSLSTPVPLGIIFKICGVKDEEIRSLLGTYKSEKEIGYVDMIVREASIVSSHKKAIKLLAKVLAPDSIPKSDRYDYIVTILNLELLPHLGPFPTKKIYFIAHTARKLIKFVMNRKNKDSDRDHYANKRVDRAGDLIEERIGSIMKRYISNVTTLIEKQGNVITAMNKTTVITKDLKYSFSSGTWGSMKNSSTAKSGVSQILSRISYKSTLSHLRRIQPPTGKDSKVTKLRQLHGSQWGIVCPAETPEGAPCGIVKNLAMAARVSTEISSIQIIEYIESKIPEIYPIGRKRDSPKKSRPDIDTKKARTCYTDLSNDRVVVMINGDLIGTCKSEDIGSVLIKLRRAREISILHPDTSISWNFKEKLLNIYTDGGRTMRALLVVKNGKLLLEDIDPRKESWFMMLKNSVIRYVDSSEEEWSRVTDYDNLKSREDAEFCEIDPQFIFSTMTATIQFSDCNQSPRNAYQAVMGKQGMGMYALNYDQRMDTFSNLLIQPQRDLVSTSISELIECDTMSNTVNPIVAIMCYGGFGQEDALIFNKSSIDRGMFNSMYYQTQQTCESKFDSFAIEKIGIPEVNLRRKSANYNKLLDNGIIKEGVYVREGDVIVGKTLVISKSRMKFLNPGINVQENRDCSLIIKPGDEGIVDKVLIDEDADGCKLVKIRIRHLRIPEIGDKFASKNAQKGTMGMMYNQEDMPRTGEGIVPDIIINPQAFPSRMTIGMLIAAVMGKVSCMNGKRYYSDPFQNLNVEKIANILIEHGFSPNGKETMYSGITGEMLTARVLMAPMAYQRLKHMVGFKEHARGRGPVSKYTRQPVSGRVNGGGLKHGEMERDVLIAHGCSALLHERLYTSSDAFVVDVCERCGIIISTDNETCRACDGGRDLIKATNIPYAAKLLRAELAAVGVDMRINPVSTGRR